MTQYQDLINQYSLLGIAFIVLIFGSLAARWVNMK